MRQIVCYCLQSEVGRRTYVGASVDVAHRLRQHNGQLSGGAKATCTGRPYKLAIVVSGFDSWREALQFEWRWKKVKLRGRRRLSPFERREACLAALLTRRPWSERPEALVVERGEGLEKYNGC